MLKLQAKAVHESVYGDAKEEKIKQLEAKVKGLETYIGECEEAVRYCKANTISFDTLTEAVEIYREREESFDEANQADFDNKLEKEGWQ